jgi:hypothetical protein
VGPAAGGAGPGPRDDAADRRGAGRPGGGADVEAALATPRTITPVLPELVLGEDDRIAFRLPGEPA